MVAQASPPHQRAGASPSLVKVCDLERKVVALHVVHVAGVERLRGKGLAELQVVHLVLRHRLHLHVCEGWQGGPCVLGGQGAAGGTCRQTAGCADVVAGCSQSTMTSLAHREGPLGIHTAL